MHQFFPIWSCNSCDRIRQRCWPTWRCNSHRLRLGSWSRWLWWCLTGGCRTNIAATHQPVQIKGLSGRQIVICWTSCRFFDKWESYQVQTISFCQVTGGRTLDVKGTSVTLLSSSESLPIFYYYTREFTGFPKERLPGPKKLLKANPTFMVIFEIAMAIVSWNDRVWSNVFFCSSS